MRGDAYSGLSRSALNAVTCILKIEGKSVFWHKQVEKRQDQDGAEGDVSTSQGMTTAVRSWKRQRTDLPLKPSECSLTS